MSTKSTRFTDAEYAEIVVQSLKLVAGRSPWLAQQILPRSTKNDTATSREIIDILNYLLEAIAAYDERGCMEIPKSYEGQINPPNWETAR